MEDQKSSIVIKEVTDPEELVKARQQRERFDRNATWLQGHISEIYSQYRGKFICVAGEKLFVADSVKEAIHLANKAYPHDNGWFTRYIPKEKVVRIYAI
jgi:hypothetical protein